MTEKASAKSLDIAVYEIVHDWKLTHRVVDALIENGYGAKLTQTPIPEVREAEG